MPALLIYLLKANSALLIFFFLYRLLLRPLTFYNTNRIFLAGGIILSTLLPLINISGWMSTRQPQSLGQHIIYYLPNLTASAQPASFNYWNILIIIFWVGVSIMLGRLIIQLLSLQKIKNASAKTTFAGTTVRNPHQYIEPFSFFKHIFINPALYETTELQMILAHEKVHVVGWHSLDILLSEACRIFCWFNPASWLLNRAIKENLEFITDRQLLSFGIKAQDYQYCLLKNTGMPAAITLANNFHFPSLKSRIIMMNKQHSSIYHFFRYLLIAPMAAIILLAFNISSAKAVKNIVHINNPEAVFGVDKVELPATAQVAKAAATDTFPEANKTKVEHINIRPKVTLADSAQPTYIVNNKIISHYQLKLINPKDIAGISVLKGDDAVNTYGSEGIHGVVAIRLKDSSNIINTTPAGKAQPIYIIDGVEQIDANAINDIPPDEIKSIDVLKGTKAIEAYGMRGENGVVKITTKGK